MKKILTIVALLVIATGAWAQDNSNISMKHERAERRDARHAAYKEFVDSLVLTRDYEFVPQTMQMQPAGNMRTIYNSGFGYYISVYPSYIQINIPIVKGYTPPYYTGMLNFDSFYPNGYIAIQEENGWSIKFSASGLDGNVYSFEFFVNYAGGETSLNVSTPVYNTVTYSGYLKAYN